MARDHHLGAHESAARLTHRGECLGKNLVEDLRDLVAERCLGAAATVRPTQLVVDALTVRWIGGYPLLLT